MIGGQSRFCQTRVAYKAGCSTTVIGRLRFRALYLLPTFGCMTIGTRFGFAIDRSSVLLGRLMAFGTNKFHRCQRFVGMTLVTSQSRVFAGQCRRMIEGVFGPRGLGGVTAAARRRNTMRANVAGLTIFRTADSIFLVAFLTTRARHDAAFERSLVFGDISAVATGTCQRGIAVRTIGRRVAYSAVAHIVWLGRSGDFVRAVDVDQAPVAIRALLLIVLRMRHTQSRPQTFFGTRFAGMATQATRVFHRRRGRQMIVGHEMSD